MHSTFDIQNNLAERQKRRGECSSRRLAALIKLFLACVQLLYHGRCLAIRSEYLRQSKNQRHDDPFFFLFPPVRVFISANERENNTPSGLTSRLKLIEVFHSCCFTDLFTRKNIHFLSAKGAHFNFLHWSSFAGDFGDVGTRPQRHGSAQWGAPRTYDLQSRHAEGETQQDVSRYKMHF